MNVWIFEYEYLCMKVKSQKLQSLIQKYGGAVFIWRVDSLILVCSHVRVCIIRAMWSSLILVSSHKSSYIVIAISRAMLPPSSSLSAIVSTSGSSNTLDSIVCPSKTPWTALSAPGRLWKLCLTEHCLLFSSNSRRCSKLTCRPSLDILFKGFRVCNDIHGKKTT